MAKYVWALLHGETNLIGIKCDVLGMKGIADAYNFDLQMPARIIDGKIVMKQDCPWPGRTVKKTMHDNHGNKIDASWCECPDGTRATKDRPCVLGSYTSMADCRDGRIWMDGKCVCPAGMNCAPTPEERFLNRGTLKLGYKKCPYPQTQTADGKGCECKTACGTGACPEPCGTGFFCEPYVTAAGQKSCKKSSPCGYPQITQTSLDEDGNEVVGCDSECTGKCGGSCPKCPDGFICEPYVREDGQQTCKKKKDPAGPTANCPNPDKSLVHCHLGYFIDGNGQSKESYHTETWGACKADLKQSKISETEYPGTYKIKCA